MEQTKPLKTLTLNILLLYFLVGQILCYSFIKIDSESSALTDNYIRVAVSLSFTDPSCILVLQLYLQSSFGADRLVSKRNLTIDQKSINITLVEDFEISKRYAYYDIRQLENPTDYYAKNIKVKACIYNEIQRFCIKELSDEVILSLNSPWRRKDLHIPCPAWSVWLRHLSTKQEIPQCQNQADTIHLLRTQLALSGKPEHGFVKALPPLRWPKHVPSRVINHVLSYPRFSLEFRIYILEKCPHAFCEILSHRLFNKFLSPVMLLNRQGLLHVQFHDHNDQGEAFVTTSPLSLKKWIHVVVAVEGYKTQLSISSEEGRNFYQKFEYRFKEIAFNSEIGVWNIGGYYGFNGFRGLICCVRVHRRSFLQAEELPTKTDDLRAMHEFDVPGLVEKCRLIRRKYHSVLQKFTNHSKLCYPKKFPQHFLNRTKDILRPKRPTSVDLKETFEVLQNSIKSIDSNKMRKVDSFAEELALLGLDKVAHSTSVAIRLFELSGCLGRLKSFLATSLAQFFQSNASSFYKSQVTSWEFYAAMYDDTLSQLALSYKYQLGCGGVQQDANIAAGYAKAAALTVKKTMEDEKQLVHTHSELIRLDEAHLFAGKRGASSDVMKWLRNQADKGSTEAQRQMAEILYHGQHGVAAQRNEAIGLYRAGAFRGDANSMYNLGVLHLRGIDVEKNETLAVDLFQKAAKKNFTTAYNSLGYYELVNKGNITGALHYWNLAKDLGDKDAMINLGIQYENGVPGILEIDKKRAFSFFKQSAEKGQKDGCIRYADYLVSGIAGERNEVAAIRYYRYVAEQLSTIGLYLRKGVDSYLAGNWSTSFATYMLLSETGLALASFNTAILCDEMLSYGMDVGTLDSNCSLYFYNLSSVLGWPASIVRMGDEYWYGKRVSVNQTKAAMNYAWVADAQESPQGLFNLAFIIENNYSVDGVYFEGKQSQMQGNLTLARILYEKCQSSKLDHGEGYYPCTIALFNLKFKSLLRDQKMALGLVALAIVIFIVLAITSSDEMH